MVRRFDAVLFDLDGTLADSMPMYIHAYDLTLRDYGLKLTEQEIFKSCYGREEYEICRDLGISGKPEDFRRIYFSNVDKFCSDVKLYPNALFVLEHFKNEEIKMVLITQAFRWYLEKMVKLLKIEKYFLYISSFNDVKEPKPHPEAVFTSCRKIGVEVDRTLLVGDSRYDIEMGKNAGCKTALLFNKENARFVSFDTLKKTNPDFSLGSFTELKNLIDGEVKN